MNAVGVRAGDSFCRSSILSLFLVSHVLHTRLLLGVGLRVGGIEEKSYPCGLLCSELVSRQALAHP